MNWLWLLKWKWNSNIKPAKARTAAASEALGHMQKGNWITMRFFDKRKKIKRVMIYISDKHNQIIIAPYYYNKAGISYEQEQIFEFDLNVDGSVLGEQVMKCFDKYEYKDKNLREHKLSDWVAYKASKSKSASSFEQDYYYISITGLTVDNYSIRIEARPFKNSEITLDSVVSRTKIGEIGRLIMNLFNICKTGRID